MRNLVAIIALTLAMAVSGSAIAQQAPTNPADCKAAGGVWDETTGTCKPKPY